ncbi:ATP-dependent DNA helicase DinG [Desertibacillus haloalkaliphilus]|uniref:ATP-dependent DNA helicase DinG n=1 Tax=Desertibacillus haloalkaliphilus TaxID=1328930 RepID=UPI001C25FC08|nr:ATP-dependent DNA helicase DinG [Desertibacillus haloalkaliphilus]MBU8907280.1 ATP-dependent DNA helicase DinG [Desertibacillus haloalkaliphilus]
MSQRFVVVDIETTGNSVKQGDRIIQIGAVAIEGGKIVERFSQFVDPEISIPVFIQQLTGIDNDMVTGAPTFVEVAPQMLELLNDAYFVAHNVQFDLSFLQNQLDLCGYSHFQGPTIDTVELSRLLMPTEDGYKLNQLASSLGLEHERPHQADSDAEVTGELLLYLLTKLERLPLITLQHLKTLAAKLTSDLEEILSQMISRKLTSVTGEDEHIDIYRQLALKHRALIERSEEPMETNFNDLHESMTNPEGPFAQSMEGYEIRDGQLEMMSQVDQAFHDHQHLLVEAGTGTGKSLGYLVPAVFYAKQQQKAVVISTHTIPLQEQLIQRDIPLLKKVIPFEFEASVLKGRSHYICLRKFEQKLAESYDDNYDTVLSKGQILVWLTETEHGDVEELNLPSGGRAFWHEIKSDGSSCTGKNCPWFSRCYYQRARRNAYQSDVIVTNHALLFSDLVSDTPLLPSYRQVIIDEAHHLEDVASDHFGVHSDYLTFNHYWNRLGTLQEGDLLYKLYTTATNINGSLESKFEQIESSINELKFEVDELFRMIHTFVVERRKASTTEIGRISYRYQAHREEGSIWRAILESTLRISAKLKELGRAMRKIVVVLEENEEQLSYAENSLVAEFNGLTKSFEQTRVDIEELLLEYDPNSVYWIEVEAKGAKNATYLYSKPIDVADRLADDFFAKKQTVVMTSATLTVNQSFDYMIDRLGLEDFGPNQSVIESPFHYETQAKLMIPTDIPSIKDVTEEEYISTVVEHIAAIAEITSGRMLLLFTSYDMLRKAHQQLKEKIGSDDYAIIGQGIHSGSRAKLMKTFKQFDKAILLGTSSFWEGIDIPGEDLSCLVIVRLPFSPPDQPVLQAKSDRLKEEGKNPFMDLALPQAIIRFKQGFGRLIRTETDRGVVIVFDKRITSTRYGKSFIRSLPPVPVSKQPIQELLTELNSWL